VKAITTAATPAINPGFLANAIYAVISITFLKAYYVADIVVALFRPKTVIISIMLGFVLTRKVSFLPQQDGRHDSPIYFFGLISPLQT
jgi:hypothetical protein